MVGFCLTVGGYACQEAGAGDAFPWMDMIAAVGPMVIGFTAAFGAYWGVQRQIRNEWRRRSTDQRDAANEAWLARASELLALARSVLHDCRGEDWTQRRATTLYNAHVLLANTDQLPTMVGPTLERDLKKRLQIAEWDNTWKDWRSRHAAALIKSSETVNYSPNQGARNAAVAVYERLLALPSALDEVVRHRVLANTAEVDDAMITLKDAQDGLDTALRELASQIRIFDDADKSPVPSQLPQGRQEQ